MSFERKKKLLKSGKAMLIDDTFHFGQVTESDSSVKVKCSEVSWKYGCRFHHEMVEFVRFLVIVWKLKRLLEGLLREERSKTRTLKMPPLSG